MAAFVGERIGIKDTTVTVTVPNNATAKLMYYLDCVATVLKLENPNLRRLKNYQNYNSLTDAEIDALLALVILFSPDELLGKVFFPSEDCGGHTNQFFELSAVSHMLAVSDNILIGGESKRVAKVMLFEMSWMDTNYFTPLKSFEGRLQRMPRGLPGRAPTPQRALPAPRPRPAPAIRQSSGRPRPTPATTQSCCNIL